MIIGNPKSFAIEFELNDNYHGTWMFGKFCYLINGKQIGDYEQGTSLRDVLFSLRQIVNDNGMRNNNNLFVLQTRELFHRLNEAFYGISTEYDNIALEETWARFNVCPAVDIFNEWKIYLIESNTFSRVIVKRLNVTSEKEDIFEVLIKPKEFDLIVERAFKELNKIYERECN